MKQIVNRRGQKHRMKTGSKEGFPIRLVGGESVSIRVGWPIPVMRQGCQDLMMKEKPNTGQ
jgi:hypothetical protein